MTIYIEPFSGLSGDMFLGALCGLTGAYDQIETLPEALRLPDGKITFREVSKNGIACRQAVVLDLNAGPPARAPHAPGHKHHHHHHRHLKDILAIIEGGDIPDGAKLMAKDIFTLIGQAESAIHNVPLEKIHFHEISAVDSILDIVGCAVLLDLLQVDKTYSDPVCTGFGMVSTQHGLLPVPAPATAALLQGMPAFKGDEAGERVTPTGAAILRFLNPDFAPPPLITRRVAYGPGQKDFQTPNVVRISEVEPPPAAGAPPSIIVVECNIDDAPAEFLGGDFQDDLLAKGALDAFYTPVNMKKGRPGIQLSVLIPATCLEQITAFLLEHTSSIGLRYYPVDRIELPRRLYQVATKYGPVQVKEVITPSGARRRKIEYESLRRISEQQGISVQQIHLELMDVLKDDSRQ